MEIRDLHKSRLFILDTREMLIICTSYAAGCFLPSAEQYFTFVGMRFSAIRAKKPQTEDETYQAAEASIRSKRELPRNLCHLQNVRRAWRWADMSSQPGREGYNAR